MSHRNPGTLGIWGPEVTGTRVVASEAMWREPIRWDRAAREAGVRRRVFTASLADVFEDWRGPMVDSAGRVLHYNSAATWWVHESTHWGPITMDFVRRRLFGLIEETPNLDWLLLTKRPENVAEMFVLGNESWSPNPAWPRNLWLGVTAEDQRRADERIPVLLSIPATVRFVSAEPLLSRLYLSRYLGERWRCPRCRYAAPPRSGWGTNPRLGWSVCMSCHHQGHDVIPDALPGVDWVIVGAESGPKRRPMEVGWIGSIAEQCRAAGVPLYVKQGSALRDGQQGDIPDALWSIKGMPHVPIGA